MGDPQIAIITPAFNSGKKLIDTHASIAAQGVEYEMLIMDGLSTDGSLDVAKRLAVMDPRVKVYSEKDKGVYDAMNRGIALATGAYIYFLGAGDTVNPLSFKEISAYLTDDLKSFVYGDCWFEGRRFDGEFTKRKLFDGNICHQSIFYGRDIFKICGMFNIKYPALSDWDFNQRCFASRRINKIYVPVMVATFEGGGVSARKDELYHADHLKLLRKNFGQWYMFKLWWEPHWWKIRGRIGRVVRKFIPGL
jgi:glycosyltransferase involved in cell wall biosynthesis